METKEIINGRYIVYSDGRIWSNYQKKFLNPRKNNSGYLFVSIGINNIFKNKTVHRIIAETFIPNPNNLPEVNHKDENKFNNHIDNLEWCSRRYNSIYSNKKKFTGSCWNNHNKKWQAVITHNNKRHFLGYYKTPEEAHNAYVSYCHTHNIT